MPEFVMTSLEGGSTAVPEEVVDAFAGRLRGRLIRPSDDGYHETRAIWNGMIDRRPALIARCAGTADVIEAVTFCRDHGVLPAVRGGGHSVAGHSTVDGGLVIDLSEMRGIWVDPQGRTVRVQGGAKWGDVDHETQAFGLATPGGVVSDTGIAGLTLGGGIGILARKYGLSCDNLLSAEVVTADGRLLRASESENPDLLWALKGGGGNLGVVTSFEFRLHQVGPLVSYVLVVYSAKEALQAMGAYRDFMLGAPDEITTDALLWSVPRAEPFPVEVQGQPALFVLGVYAGPAEEGRRAMQPLKEFGTPVADLSDTIPYAQVQRLFDEDYPAGQFHYWKSLYIDDPSDAALEVFVDRGLERPSPESSVELFSMGGAIARVPAEATAFGRRDAPFLLMLESNWTNPHENEKQIAWTRDLWSAMQPFSKGGLYLNFPGLVEEGSALLQAAHGPSFARLVEAKTTYDPHNMFRLNSNIRPKEQARHS
jgi:FAD/FMN-containing dehydrogenase